MKTITKSARLSMKTKTNTLVGAVLFLLVIAAAAPGAHAQLVGHWTFDEGSGTNAIDSSGNGNDGSLVGPPTYSPDTPFGSGSSLLFLNTPYPAPASQYVEISNPANLPTSAISIAAWVKIPTSRPSGAMVIVAKGGGGITDSFVLYQNTSFGSFGAVFSFEFVGGSSGGVGGPLIPEDGQWHHVAGTWASGSPARIYLDGVLVASSSSAFSGMIRYNSSFPISIGADFDPGPGLGWHGHIDDVRIYGHALSDAEVQELVRGNQPPLATDDFYGMNQSSSLSVPTPGVLANDTDPDEDALTAELVTGPASAASFQFNPDGSFTYTPPPYFYGEDSFTYRAYDGTAYSEIATVHVTVSQPGSQGFITGGGKFFQDGRKCTFGFVAKVQGNGVQGNLEFQDHDMSLDVKAASMAWVYAPNQVDGSFSGTCRVNGVGGYTFFVQVHDRGQPGSNDDFAIWVFDSFNNPVYSAGALLSGGNIVIHGH